jgi:RNA polymerase sigma-70 factor (ECF subfamily)
MELILKQPGQTAIRQEDVGAGPDARLLQRIKTGDAQAFERIVKTYFEPAWRVAVRILRNEAEAEDVAQGVFLKIWQNPPELKPGASFRAWILRVASNGAIDQLRKKRPVPVAELPEQVDGAVSAEQALQAGEAASQVQVALEELPERQRLALILTYYEGLANKEAADVLGVSVDALESLLSRARRGLKANMSGIWQDLLVDLTQKPLGDGQW